MGGEEQPAPDENFHPGAATMGWHVTTIVVRAIESVLVIATAALGIEIRKEIVALFQSASGVSVKYLVFGHVLEYCMRGYGRCISEPIILHDNTFNLAPHTAAPLFAVA